MSEINKAQVSVSHTSVALPALPVHIHHTMLVRKALPAVLLVVQTSAQITLSGTNEASTITDVPSGSYISYTGTSNVPSNSIALNATVSALYSSLTARNSSATATSTSSATVTYLTGGGGASISAGNSSSTVSSTSSSAQPTNTQPCNGYPEFCNRKYSNITMVTAHNSPFTIPNNAASNQVLPVLTQLSDGVRMLQSESHYINDTMHLCHTSCDLLNAGTLESYLTTVVGWLQKNPYEVLTILMVNSDYVDPGNYSTPIINSGLLSYLYEPPKVPMGVNDWPTLAEMIITGKRVVFMLDYQANQTEFPYILDEFGQMWETPFSPTNASFPCTAQRPPANYGGSLPRTNRMYMANHNLNIDISIGSFSLLIPAYGSLNVTNADEDQIGMVEATRLNCTEMWNRPPNFLLVDYYNFGNFNGSVFEVAARANNVTFNRNSCCGTSATSAAGMVSVQADRLLVATVFAVVVALLVI